MLTANLKDGNLCFYPGLSVRAISTLVPICWTRQSRNTNVQLIIINNCLNGLFQTSNSKYE